MKKSKLSELIRECIREVLKEEEAAVEVPKSVETADKKMADLSKLVKQLPPDLKSKLVKKLKAAQGDVTSYIDSLEPKKEGLKEAMAQFKVGQVVQDNDEVDVKILKVYPNKQAALSNLKGAPDFSKMMKDLKDLSTSYTPISKDDDMSPWYVIVSDAEPGLGRYLVPESHLFEI